MSITLAVSEIVLMFLVLKKCKNWASNIHWWENLEASPFFLGVGSRNLNE